MDRKFAALYKQNIGLVIYFCRRHFNLDQPTAEDIAQSAFLKAHVQFSSLRDVTKFRSWVMTIARNEAISHLRKVKRMGIESQEVDTIADVGSGDPRHEAELQLVAEVIEEAQLDQQTQAIFSGFYRDGKSVKELAAQLGLPTSTVTTKLSRTRHRLRKHIADKIIALREKWIHNGRNTE